MGKVKTLAALKASVATEGAYEGSDDITGTVLTDYINKALVRGREIIVSTWEDYYTVASTPFQVVSGVDSYTLPSDFEHLRKVEIALDAAMTKWRRLYPVDLSSTTRFQNAYARKYRYRMQGGPTPFVLVPAPGASSDMIRVWYIPYAPELVNDIDSIQINVDVEYELYVALALRRCKIREDLDTSQVEATIADCVARLQKMADMRDAGEPFYLSDHTDDGRDEEWGW